MSYFLKIFFILSLTTLNRKLKPRKKEPIIMNRRYIYDKVSIKIKFYSLKSLIKLIILDNITEQEGGRWKERERERKERSKQ